MTPEQKARVNIDALLVQAGWHVCHVANANIHASVGVAIREFPLNNGFGFADYLLYVNGKACGVIEAKKEGATLTGVEVQSGRYAQGLPTSLPAWRRPLPFLFESTGVETHFTNGLDPEPRARSVFAFFRPELLVQWLAYLRNPATDNAVNEEPGIKALADALHAPPHLIDEGALWQAYAAVKKDKVKGASQRRLMTDLVSLVRFAMQQDNELVPYPERVQANFKAWLAQHQQHTTQPFTQEQQHWLEMIRDHIAANLGIEIDDFEYAPFNTEGGLGKVHQLFGAELPKVIEELNRELAA
jgi:type I site-specific restriction endonuclease